MTIGTMDATRLNNPPAGLAREDIETPPEAPLRIRPASPTRSSSGPVRTERPSSRSRRRRSTSTSGSRPRRSCRRRSRRTPSSRSSLIPELDRAKQVEFYEHEMGWANRLILGDSLVVMTSLLERERHGRAGADESTSIRRTGSTSTRTSRRGSRTERRKETDDGSLTREPEQIQAYRDTWELGVHSYLTYLRERLVAGSGAACRRRAQSFVQIGPDNMHLVRSPAR